MAQLKTYSITNDFSSGVIIDQLHDQILSNGCITDFVGLTKYGDSITVNGSSMDESALDAVISAHVPNTTLIYIQNTVADNKAFADDMMQKMKEKNLIEGLSSIDQAAWVHHRLRKVEYTLSDNITVVQIDVMNLVVSGDIETAENVLGQMTPDNMTESYHWWTQARIDWVRNEIRTYLGWPLI